MGMRQGLREERDQDEGAELCKLGTVCGHHEVVWAGQDGTERGWDRIRLEGWDGMGGMGGMGWDGVRTGCDGKSGVCDREGMGSELAVVGWEWGEMRWEEDMTRRRWEWHRDMVKCAESWTAIKMEWGEGSLVTESNGIGTRWDKEREET